MKRFLSMLAMAVLVLQSVVTSLVYAADQANPSEESDSVPVVEATVVDEVSDEGGNEGVTADLTDTELPVVEEPIADVVADVETPTIEEQVIIEPEVDLEETDFYLPRFNLFKTPASPALIKSINTENPQGACKPGSMGTCIVDPVHTVGSLVNPGDVQITKVVEATDIDGEYKITIEVKGNPVSVSTHNNVCAVVVFDRSGSMGTGDKVDICTEGYAPGECKEYYKWRDDFGSHCSSRIDCECKEYAGEGECKTYGQEYKKWIDAVAGAKLFATTLNGLNEGENKVAKIGLVTFADDASIGRNLDFSDLSDGYFSKHHGGTNLDAGLQKAQELLNDDSFCKESNTKKYIVAITDGAPTYYSNGGDGHATYTNVQTVAPKTAERARIIRGEGIGIFTIGYQLEKIYNSHHTDYFDTAEYLKKDIANQPDNEISQYAFEGGNESEVASAFRKISEDIQSQFAGTEANLEDNIGENVTIVTTDENQEPNKLEDFPITGQIIEFYVKIKDGAENDDYDTNAGVYLTYTGYDSEGNPIPGQELSIEDSSKIHWVQPACEGTEPVEGVKTGANTYPRKWNEAGDALVPVGYSKWTYVGVKQELEACEWTCDEGYKYDEQNNTCLKKHVVTVDPNCAEGEEGKDCKVITGDVNHGSKYTLPILERKYTLTYNEHGNITTGDYAAKLKGYCEGTPKCADEMLKKVGEEVDILSDVTYYAAWDETDLTVKVKKGENYQDAEYIYTFKNWKGSDNNDIEAEDELTLVKDETLVAQYDKESRNATYTVEYHFQNVEGNGYDNSRTENKAGITDTEVSVSPEEIPGFTLNNESSILTGTISADGKLVLKVYYDRVESSIIIDLNCKDENVVCDVITKTGNYEKEVTLPEKIRNYTLSYKVPEGASGVDSQTVTATVTRYCKGNSDDCGESEGFPVGYPVKIEAESVTYTAVWSNDMTVTVADGSNYQTDSTVYTFNTWKDGENDVATGSTLTLTSHKELVANYTESCNTGYHYEDTATAKVCVSDYKEVACKQEGAPEHAHYNVTSGAGTWDGTGYVGVNCSWDCDSGYRKDGNICRTSGGGGGGSSSSSYSCKNLPDNAVANNSSKPTNKDTDYSYSTGTDEVCTFQCKAGYTYNSEKNTCVKSGGGNGGGDEVIELGGEVSDKCSVEGTNRSEEEKAAYLYACENDITTIRDINEARLGDFLTRAEMAKMISVFATKELGMKPNTSKDCSNFANSIANYNQEMKDYMVMSCQLEIMGIHTTNYEAIPDFMPNKHVSRAEFGTVLSRILWGNKYEGTNSNYYVNHLNALKENSIITNIDPTITEYRAWVFLMLYRSVEAIKLAKATTAEETVEEQVNEELKSETGSTVEVESGEVSTGAVAETETGSTVEAQTGDTTTTTGDIAKETEVVTGDTVETGSTND